MAMPSPVGPWSQVFINGNGRISYATNNGIQPNSYPPGVAGFLSAPATAFFSRHDFTRGAGSGRVQHEEALDGTDTIAYVTGMASRTTRPA